MSLFDFCNEFLVYKNSDGTVRKPNEFELENLKSWNDKMEQGFKPVLRKGRGIDKIIWVKIN